MISRFEIMRDEGIDIKSITRVGDVMPFLKKSADSISLIILDIIIPPEEHYSLQETNGGTATGIRLLEDIRAEYKSIPIIIVSIRRRHSAENILTKYLISEYLEKPISTADIIRSIRRVIKTS
jgi:CheY-like chemotaxis protein